MFHYGPLKTRKPYPQFLARERQRSCFVEVNEVNSITSSHVPARADNCQSQGARTAQQRTRT